VSWAEDECAQHEQVEGAGEQHWFIGRSHRLSPE
jgi:hypothetical protein